MSSPQGLHIALASDPNTKNQQFIETAKEKRKLYTVSLNFIFISKNSFLKFVNQLLNSWTLEVSLYPDLISAILKIEPYKQTFIINIYFLLSLNTIQLI